MLWKIRLVTKLMMSFVTVLFVTGLVIAAYAYISAKSDIEGQTLDKLTLLNEAKMIAVDNFLSGETDRAVDFASDGFIRDELAALTSVSGRSAEALNNHITRNKLPLDKDIFEIEIIDSKGIVRAAVNTDEIGEDYSDLDFFKNARNLEYGHVYVGDISLYENENYEKHLPVLTFAAPLTDKITGEKIGVLVNRVRLRRLDSLTVITTSIEKCFYTGETCLDLYLVGSTGFIITKPSNGGSELVLNQKISDDIAGNCGFRGYHKNYAGKDVFMVTACFPNGWMIISEIDNEEIFAGIRMIERGIWLIFSILAAVIFVLSYFSVGRIIKPLKHLTRVAAKFGAGNLEERVIVRSEDEIGQLAESFNKMAERLRASYALLEGKVAEQTKELRLKISELDGKNKDLSETKEAILNVLEDLSAERRKLEEEGAKDVALLDSLGEAVIAIDLNGKIIFINKVAEKLFRVVQDNVVGRFYADFWDFELGEAEKIKVPEEEKPFIKVLKTGKPIHSSGYNISIEGSGRISVSLITSPIIYDGKTIGVIEVIRDISEEKKVERAKSEFVSIASHQLRTPLTAIKWYIESLLAGDAGKLNKKQNKYFEEVYHGSERMTNIIGALLDASRVELGTLAKENKEIILKEECEKVLGELSGLIEKNNLKVVQKYEKNFPIIKSDPRAIKLILQNIISNAVKYTPKGGEIAITVEKSGSRALLSVADSGVGIPHDAQDKIFTKFFRADNVRLVVQEGTGLGLYIAKQAIEQLKGKIWFDTILGKGTTFYVELPLNNNTEEA